ncbi:flagellar protein FliS [Solidesulfovibrio fructosivorans JJ]]|uniref:Flagellar protein FliS n=1 Tax=Solidesulfovibrio fructosivorans JJ] TaxID=596151 RepID=E1JSF2_SOLFR|nr:flagellar export chaperone FliS [Solidesulfovibrio fructosivorans]EFL52921.1 flagellar protein FliS [Solidesulfovibrio fructosivorans JJ]]
MQAAARSYFQTQVATTTQGDLLIMLFDAALKFLSQAKEKIAEKNYAQKGILISKVLDILSELQGSLNAQKGGDLADRLQKLYFFCSARLLAANLKMDVAKIDEVVTILTGLREAFSEANQHVATKTVPTSATSTASLQPGAMSGQTAKPAAQALYLAQAGPAAAPGQSPKAAPASAATAATRAPVKPVVPSAAPATPPAATDVPVEAPVREFETVDTPTAAPVRRVMAAYAASRVQG